MAVIRITNINLATCAPDKQDIGIIRNTELWLQQDKILSVGPPRAAIQPDVVETLDGRNGWCLPGFVDCHTHLVYGGNRAADFARRLDGVSYAQISAEGGGIKSTVAQTRQASAAELSTQALKRASRLAEEGVTLLEIKSGYGLDFDTEVQMLKVARAVQSQLPLTVKTTYLGAHALPDEYKDQPDEYIDFVCNQMIPYVSEQRLASAVDVFCETVGFTPDQCERVFRAARQAGLDVKGHVEQLSNQHGAALAARYQALSVDHIEYLQDADIGPIKQAGSVAVLLPGAFYYLRETRTPPIAALRKHAVPMAVSTDLNPGTSPLCSLLTAANMACVLFGLTPDEALLGITRHGAQALNVMHKGYLAPGMDADLTLWDVAHPHELVYTINGHRPQARFAGGLRVG